MKYVHKHYNFDYINSLKIIILLCKFKGKGSKKYFQKTDTFNQIMLTSSDKKDSFTQLNSHVYIKLKKYLQI